MPVIVNTNVQSLVAQRHLSHSTTSLATATQRLSTGLKINRAADDAAGLFIAKGLESQLRGSQQCQTNIALGINVLQIAEGDLTTIQENVMRIKDLTTQAANGVYSTAARLAMANEVKARIEEIDRISKASTFNGKHLLDGTDDDLKDGLRLQVGAGSPADANAIIIKGVFDDASDAKGIGIIADATTVDTAFASASASALYIATCEKALDNVSAKRASIGVVQSRLEMTAESLAVTIENVSAAKSTIMDTDVAATTSEYTRAQILQQIGTSMLTQANAAPQIALSLLG